MGFRINFFLLLVVFPTKRSVVGRFSKWWVFICKGQIVNDKKSFTSTPRVENHVTLSYLCVEQNTVPSLLTSSHRLWSMMHLTLLTVYNLFIGCTVRTEGRAGDTSVEIISRR